MDLVEALRTTGSVRSFTSAPVSDESVAQILDDARFAPSGGNRQPWRVAVVRDTAIRVALADAMRPVWNDYVSASAEGATPFAHGHGPTRAPIAVPNELLDRIVAVPVVLVVAADLGRIALMDSDLARPPITAGGSVYPFCWSVLLAARARGLAGVLTTFLSRVEPQVEQLLALPPDHALAATMFLGVANHRPTRLKRRPVEGFATCDTFDGPPLHPGSRTQQNDEG